METATPAQPAAKPVLAFIGARLEKLRRVPQAWQCLYLDAAHFTAKRRRVIRTGAAPGCDQWAADAALRAGADVELILPWEGFSAEWVEKIRQPGYSTGSASITVYDPKRHAHWAELVERCHPAPDKLTPAARCLMARNVGIIEGATGVVALPLRELHGRAGGTGFGIRIARELGIQVWDLTQLHARDWWEVRLRDEQQARVWTDPV